MQLGGMHHITMITGDAPRNVEFYADVLGLRLVKKTVNFDAPEAYHLYFGDERGSPGSILTWFEFAGAPRGRAGAGMIHTIQLGVASEASLDFWADRLAARAYASERGERSLRSRTTTAWRSSWSSPTVTRRCGPSIPTCRPSTRSSASRAPAPTPPAGSTRTHGC
jgi:catechol 2,3-dioxygenase-like lactoylglutathione lyase family enzyme